MTEYQEAKAIAKSLRPWFKKKRYWVLAFFVISAIGSAISDGDSSKSVSSKSSTNSVDSSVSNTGNSSASPQETSAPKESISQKNARSKAETYLDVLPFSRTGLIKQLNFDGFSDSDGAYAVDSITVDWNEQAALKSKSYLDIMSFSRSGLITQLLFDGFTQSQAEYGVSTTGL